MYHKQYTCRTVARYELKRALEGWTRPVADAWYRGIEATGPQSRL